MKRFFKYRTVEDLAEEIERLGLSEDIKLSENFEALLHPVKVAGREVKNALVIHPMEGCDGTHDGKPDLLTYRRYERFGSGGAGIIWFEATAATAL
jgi:hypothetical protein